MASTFTDEPPILGQEEAGLDEISGGTEQNIEDLNKLEQVFALFL